MYVFDLDGTIALNEHRQHFVTRPKGERDWKSFNEHAKFDTPNHGLAAIMKALFESGHYVAILSGRGMEVHQETIDWLEQWNINYHYLDMRPIGDHREDQVIKLEMLNKLLELEPNDPVDAIFDDRKRVVDMWRENGYTCFQVAPGDF